VTVLADYSQSGEDDASARGLMPPYVVLQDFLDESTVAGLLDYATSHQFDFASSKIESKGVDSSHRVSKVLPGLGQYASIFDAKILDLVPALVAQMRATPIREPKIETELAAHGDGAFYKRHVDTQTGHYPDAERIRILSCVYYFYAEPKAFTGGALRLHSIGGKKGDRFVDIEPLRNSLLAFLAWAPHEVLPVACPSKEFIASRFAVNCWVHGKKPGFYS
jgi:SM-20-related protein